MVMPTTRRGRHVDRPDRLWNTGMWTGCLRIAPPPEGHPTGWPPEQLGSAARREPEGPRTHLSELLRLHSDFSASGATATMNIPYNHITSCELGTRLDSHTIVQSGEQRDSPLLVSVRTLGDSVDSVLIVNEKAARALELTHYSYGYICLYKLGLLYTPGCRAAAVAGRRRAARGPRSSPTPTHAPPDPLGPSRTHSHRVIL